MAIQLYNLQGYRIAAPPRVTSKKRIDFFPREISGKWRLIRTRARYID